MPGDSISIASSSDVGSSRIDDLVYTPGAGKKREQELLEQLAAVRGKSDGSFSIVIELEAPGTDDMTSYLILVQNMKEEQSEEQLKQQKEAITFGADQQKAATDKMISSTKEAASKAAEAQGANKKVSAAEMAQTILGLIAAIGFLIGTIAAGGAGGLVAMAVIGLVTAIQDTTNMGLKMANDGKGTMVKNLQGKDVQLDLSFGGLVAGVQDLQRATGAVLVRGADGKVRDPKGNILTEDQVKVLEKAGVRVATEENLQKEAMAMTIMLQSALMIGMLAGGVAAMRGVSGFVSKIDDMDKMARMFQRVTTQVGSFTDLGQAVTGITIGGLKVEIARINRDTDRARAQSDFFTKVYGVLQQAQKDRQGAMLTQIRAYNQDTVALTEAIANAGDAQANTARAIAN